MGDFWIWFTTLLTGGGLLMTVGLPVCICGVSLAAVGIVGVVLYQRVFAPARLAKRLAQTWPAATGVVLSSFVNTETSYDSTASAEVTSFKPHITYEYEVSGQRYRSDRLRASDGFYSVGMLPGSAQAVVNRYPAGAHVTVYYNPDNPQEALLER